MQCMMGTLLVYYFGVSFRLFSCWEKVWTWTSNCWAQVSALWVQVGGLSESCLECASLEQGSLQTPNMQVNTFLLKNKKEAP